MCCHIAILGGLRMLAHWHVCRTLPCIRMNVLNCMSPQYPITVGLPLASYPDLTSVFKRRDVCLNSKEHAIACNELAFLRYLPPSPENLFARKSRYARLGMLQKVELTFPLSELLEKLSHWSGDRKPAHASSH